MGLAGLADRPSLLAVDAIVEEPASSEESVCGHMDGKSQRSAGKTPVPILGLERS